MRLIAQSVSGRAGSKGRPDEAGIGMLQFIACLAFLVQSTNRNTEAAAGFDERLKRATGPAQLKQLESWCGKNKLDEEKKRVRELLAKAGPPAKPAVDAAQREAARAAS